MSEYVTRLRARVGSRKIILVYATALIRNEHGQLLFQRRSDFDGWGLPGGVLEIGETLSACCVREAREETGYQVEPVRLVGLYSGPQYDVRYPNGDQVQQFTVALEGRIVGGTGRVDGTESRAQAFFPPEALPPTSLWYADMARHCLAEQPQAFFEAPRPQSGREKTAARFSAGWLRQPPRPGHQVTPGEYVMGLRAQVGALPLIGAGANGLIRDEAGRVLLIQRADNGQWNTPGGYSDLGESAAETAVREVEEEVGLRVAPTRLINVRTGPDHQVRYSNGDETQVCVALFECRVLGGELRPDPAEVRQAAFFAPDALPEPMPARARQRVADAVLNAPHALYS
jgi:ADP-ribose pyrophosphatase YjhB (NUDIX family)